MPTQTIEWEGDIPGRIALIDQSLLPERFEVIRCDDLPSIWEAIRTLRVRGAPAIGIAAAFGLLLGIQHSRATRYEELESELEEAIRYLGTSRPTAVNLFWALDRMKRAARASRHKTVPGILRDLLAEARSILKEDVAMCRKIGELGQELVPDGAAALTHCNAGGLATGGFGTALGVFYAAAERGKGIRVFADETRPLLQGARLTTFELVEGGLDVTLICDNMAGYLMQLGKIDLVVVGADRIARNGDVANKIGTYSVAVLARENGIPFYVAAPSSTFDLSLASGAEIPIEERSPEEITVIGGRRIAPEGIKTFNPAFDVTPARYIAAIITEKGIIREPDEGKIRLIMGGGIAKG
jgi:methylthioribose-1-phosphate isomerase